LGNKKKLLSTFQINNLVENGWEIGFHSLTHSNFSKLTNKQLRYEVYLGKNKTEKKLGIKLKYFSFPRGFYNTQIIKSVSDSGFAGFTVKGSESSSARLLFHELDRGQISDDDFGANIGLGSIFHTLL
jgi:peptidoglycan/xylan/chitin deacetylase (PgdA/CDA1 family)